MQGEIILGLCASDLLSHALPTRESEVARRPQSDPMQEEEEEEEGGKPGRRARKRLGRRRNGPLAAGQSTSEPGPHSSTRDDVRVPWQWSLAAQERWGNARMRYKTLAGLIVLRGHVASWFLLSAATRITVPVSGPSPTGGRCEARWKGDADEPLWRGRNCRYPICVSPVGADCRVSTSRVTQGTSLEDHACSALTQSIYLWLIIWFAPGFATDERSPFECLRTPACPSSGGPAFSLGRIHESHTRRGGCGALRIPAGCEVRPRRCRGWFLRSMR
jgi:hypothetical protein